MNSWIFQGNPESFDISGYVAAANDILWTVNQSHLASEMRQGDRVFLWRAGGTSPRDAGVIAQAIITDEPSVRPVDSASIPFWRNGSDALERLRVGLRIARVASSREVIRREWLKEDPILRDLRILKLASETNYRLSPEQAERLAVLWRNTGRDWGRAETVAGLWAYYKTLNGEISKRPGSPVADVALLIGRAVAGTYNKVMNFRALDPTDSRSGFSGGGTLAAGVWSEFFDPTTGSLRGSELEEEFQRLWLVPGGTETERGSSAAAIDSDWELVRSAAEVMLRRGGIFTSQKQQHRYRVVGVDDQRITVARLDSRQPEVVTAGEVARAVVRLDAAGGSIQRGKLNGTVAKEVTVVTLHPQLTWSDDGDWIRRVDAEPPPPRDTYKDFGQAPNDDPQQLAQFARRVRAGQPRFRNNLLRLYGSRCAISGWGPAEVLEAAHIVWHAESGVNHTDNGLLLRSDLHTLFDQGLLRIHPDSFAIHIDDALKDSPYWDLNGRALRPREDGTQPSRSYLRRRWDSQKSWTGGSPG